MSGKKTDNRDTLVPTGQLSAFADDQNVFFQGFNQSRAPSQCLASIVEMTQKLHTDTYKSIMASFTDQEKDVLYTSIRTNIGRLDRELKELYSMRRDALEGETKDTSKRPELVFDQSKECAEILHGAASFDWSRVTTEERLEQISTCHNDTGECTHWAGWTSPKKQVEISEAFVQLKMAFAELDPKSVHTNPESFIDTMRQCLLGHGTDAEKVSSMTEQAWVAQKSTWGTLPSEASLDKQFELAVLVAGYQRQGKLDLAGAVNNTLDAFRANDRVFRADAKYGFETDAGFRESLEEML